ncbi:CocE/NonD family hydrolase [Pseudomonas abieticivorans]|uniref:CocE/NonD family hydrolase n=1 Tax=Pseudomonas abieticivorans TaxID=2931382 RepID=UPI0020C0E49D|nr:CocE/NonD family hydrolase [Pseudomonas sp. PIA16]
MTVLRNKMIGLRDGVHLATDIYLPQGTGPWPVVIERTPYDKAKPSRSEKRLDGQHLTREQMAAALTQRGFVAIFQDCRGRYASQGVFTKYVNEGQDGYDTLAWIVEQPWCNGRIGSMGLSYAAHTQLAMACLNPPGLATMVLDSGGFANAFQCGIRQGGAFELKQATWAYKQARESAAVQADPLLREALDREDIRSWFARMPWRPGYSPLRHVPEYEDYLFEQWSHGQFDDYWKQLGIYAEGYYDQIPDIPVLFMSSWYDAYVSSTLDNFNAFTRTKQSPQRLIMGPWLHGDRNISHSGNAEFGQAANFDGNLDKDWLSCRLDWLQRWLQPGDDIAGAPHQVDVFLMGGGIGQKNPAGRLEHGGQWLNAQHWPLPGSHEHPLYLTAQGGLASHAAAAPEPTLSYYSDPANPVPTVGGALTSGAPVFVGGAFDQVESPDFFGTRGDNTPLCQRSDVLSFETPPLEQDLIVAGPLRIELWVQSSAPDTDFTAKLVDVYPPSRDYPKGYAMNITDGILRCRYRHSWEHPQLIAVGEPFKVVIEPFATCNRFKRGHRIRLDIASSNFPRFDVNPNSGEPEGKGERPRIALNILHLNAKHPSRLILTVLPAASQENAPTPAG